MMSASVAGRFPARSRLGHAPRRPPMLLHRPALGQSRLPVAAIVLSMALHVLFFAVVAALAMWAAWSPRKTYMVNLVPMVAAVGLPNATRVSTAPVRTPAPPAAAPAPPTAAPAPRVAPPALLPPRDAAPASRWPGSPFGYRSPRCRHRGCRHAPWLFLARGRRSRRRSPGRE